MNENTIYRYIYYTHIAKHPLPNCDLQVHDRPATWSCEPKH